MSGHILACGAGRTLMDKRDDPIHRFTLELAGKERPRVLFLGTAAADDPSYIVSFYETYCARRCAPAHLRLFHISERHIHKFILGHDVIHVAGSPCVVAARLPRLTTVVARRELDLGCLRPERSFDWGGETRWVYSVEGRSGR